MPVLRRILHFSLGLRNVEISAQRQVLNIIFSRLNFQPNSSTKSLTFAATSSVEQIHTIDRSQLQVTVPTDLESGSDEVRYLSDLFKIETDEAERLVDLIKVDNSYASRQTRKTALEIKIDILQSYNIPRSAIKNKFSVMRITIYELQKRLDYLWVYGIDLCKDPEKHLETLLDDRTSVQDKKKTFLAFRLNCSIHKINKLCEHQPQFLLPGIKTLKKNLDTVLAEKFVTREVIFRSGRIFAKHPVGVEENLTLLKQWIREEVKDRLDDSEINENDLCRLEEMTDKTFEDLILLPRNKLKQLRRTIDTKLVDWQVLRGKTKQEYLAQRFNCSMEDIENLIKKKPLFLSLRNYTKLDKNLDLLFNSGYIKPRDIMRCPQIAFFRTKCIERRIQQLNDLKFSNEKQFLTAFRETNDEHFKKVVSEFVKVKEILDKYSCKTREEYIKLRLQCTDEELQSGNMAQLRNMRLSKLNTMLDFLYKECFLPPKQVVKYPRILYTSLDTVKARKMELDEIGYPLSTPILGMPSDNYKKRVQEFSKSGVIYFS
ncbi:hypothetical protein SNE40_021920 [Patella caerulea]|uniref:Mitochondrial transcription termination factor n=1 Tax=Patella caerulea TaxID=87958 RepID=A0AAN8G8U8_PATCE